MSRAYDAKQAALAVHKENRRVAIEFFLGYLDCCEADFEYEFGKTVEEYVFGGENKQ